MVVLDPAEQSPGLSIWHCRFVQMPVPPVAGQTWSAPHAMPLSQAPQSMLPPQTWPPAQAPQSSERPQPSPIGPQYLTAPPDWQVIAVQLGPPMQMPGFVSPPLQVASPGQAPHSSMPPLQPLPIVLQ